MPRNVILRFLEGPHHPTRQCLDCGWLWFADGSPCPNCEPIPSHDSLVDEMIRLDRDAAQAQDPPVTSSGLES